MHAERSGERARWQAGSLPIELQLREQASPAGIRLFGVLRQSPNDFPMSHACDRCARRPRRDGHWWDLGRLGKKLSIFSIFEEQREAPSGRIGRTVALDPDPRKRECRLPKIPRLHLDRAEGVDVVGSQSPRREAARVTASASRYRIRPRGHATAETAGRTCRSQQGLATDHLAAVPRGGRPRPRAKCVGAPE